MRACIVKPNAAACSAAAALALMLIGGCATNRPTTASVGLVAMRYDVAPARMNLSDEQSLDAARRDFAAIRRLGFETALLQHVPDEDRMPLLDAAVESGLRLAVPDRGIDFFVTTGVGDADSLVRDAAASPAVSHPAFAALALRSGHVERACRRLETVRRLLSAKGLPTVIADSARHCEGVSAPAVVSTAPLWAGPPGEASARLLDAYVRELREGRTGGLIVDRFARLPGDPPGVASADSQAGHRAALTALLARSQQWGPLLAGSEVRTMASVEAAAPGSTTLFLRGPRRYVLIHNEANDRFVRKDVALPTVLAERPVVRAVEVVPAGQPGAIVSAPPGKPVVIAIELRPQDAVLYELF